MRYGNVNDHYKYEGNRYIADFDASSEEEAVQNAQRIFAKISRNPQKGENVQFATRCFQFQLHELIQFELLARRELMEPLVYLSKAKPFPEDFIPGKKKKKGRKKKAKSKSRKVSE